jgi:hypothetical protein
LEKLLGELSAGDFTNIVMYLEGAWDGSDLDSGYRREDFLAMQTSARFPRV